MNDMTDEEALAALEEFPVSIRGGIIERARIALREKVAAKKKVRLSLEDAEAGCVAASALRTLPPSEEIREELKFAANLIKVVREDTIPRMTEFANSKDATVNGHWFRARLRALGVES